MSDNKKQEKDFTKEVDARLPEAAEIVKVCVIDGFQSNILICHDTQVGKLQAGLDTIFALEKQTRNVGIYKTSLTPLTMYFRLPMSHLLHVLSKQQFSIATMLEITPCLILP